MRWAPAFLLALLLLQNAWAETKQVGAFSLLENAKKLQARLKAQGKDAFIKEVEVRGRRFYRVYVRLKPPGKPREKPPRQKVPLPEEPLHLRLVLLDSLPKAQEVLQALEAGTPLALLARKHSTDPAARQSYGYLGRVKPQALEAPLREALRGLAPGRHTGIVELPEGRFAIAQIIDMRDYQEAEKAFREENFDLAERHLLRHLQNNPDASRSRLMLGKIQELKGRLTQAEATYKEAIRYHPELAEAYAMLGRLYLKMGLYEQAKEVFEEGLRYSDSPLLEEGLELAHILMLQTQGAMP